MKKLIFISSMFLSFTLIAQKTDKTEKKLKEITGIITLEGAPLTGVNILIKNSNRGSNTSTKGFYKIQARVGEIIQFFSSKYETSRNFSRRRYYDFKFRNESCRKPFRRNYYY